jgi:hypothetical protein
MSASLQLTEQFIQKVVELNNIGISISSFIKNSNTSEKMKPIHVVRTAKRNFNIDIYDLNGKSFLDDKSCTTLNISVPSKQATIRKSSVSHKCQNTNKAQANIERFKKENKVDELPPSINPGENRICSSSTWLSWFSRDIWKPSEPVSKTIATKRNRATKKPCTVVCTGTTSRKLRCRNKTFNKDGLCYRHVVIVI